MSNDIKNYFRKNTEAAPLAVFRIFFGIMMLLSIIRFWSYGWIDKLYIQPKLFFSYYGFEFIKPIAEYTYLIFALCALSAIFVTLGYKYRIAIITFFLGFTYIELMDKTTYLNHYYFISLLSFLMIFLPANAYYSLDARIKGISFQQIPKWSIDTIKLLLGIVYFYAGLAKLNSDWLLKAMPLKIWLPSKYSIPLLGDLMHQEWVHYLFSYTGAVYDLTVPFLLLYKRTRIFAFVLVVVFHVLTRVLFPIGMFPYIMIVSTLIFFDANLHHKILQFISKLFRIDKHFYDSGTTLLFTQKRDKIVLSILSVFFVIQLLLPFRYLLYPGELFWTEEGFRFSWRVMLIEKAGYANFKIVDSKTGKRFYVDNDDFLTSFQQKQMATQPDFILQYAHYLKKHFEEEGYQNVEVYVESYVGLNGRLSTQYIDPEVDLGKQKESFKHKNWIIPFKDEIKGL
ncbi:HTTM domain-containing protein [Aquimarina gracilis]|uniref:HTTM domain-containing protein n=1 Tax=Aquimarina gracilis TaxID=874422 RepID=A0ABU5ZYR8_9FLAO|nr:HTTM domain-containing protein [Aquimarina gracilis]MEB3346965.1 HTTM domain-containing protein [Aquimarina gracilis]